jgi:hypothetical protein
MSSLGDGRRWTREGSLARGRCVDGWIGTAWCTRSKSESGRSGSTEESNKSEAGGSGIGFVHCTSSRACTSTVVKDAHMTIRERDRFLPYHHILSPIPNHLPPCLISYSSSAQRRLSRPADTVYYSRQQHRGETRRSLGEVSPLHIPFSAFPPCPALSSNLFKASTRSEVTPCPSFRLSCRSRPRLSHQRRLPFSGLVVPLLLHSAALLASPSIVLQRVKWTKPRPTTFELFIFRLDKPATAGLRFFLQFT